MRGEVFTLVKNEGKKAVSIGVVCILTYLANYFLRHLLSVLTPQLIETDNFTVEHIGVLSSTYMIFYAAGQLVNGILGDYISPKKMVFMGIFAAGVVCIVFPFAPFEFFAHNPFRLLWICPFNGARSPYEDYFRKHTAKPRAYNMCFLFVCLLCGTACRKPFRNDK